MNEERRKSTSERVQLLDEWDEVGGRRDHTGVQESGSVSFLNHRKLVLLRMLLSGLG